MTKYSKMKKSSFAILALSLILVAILAFGGTYAYFNASATGSASVTTGVLTMGDSFTVSIAETSLVPNQAAPATVSADVDLAGDTVAALKISLGAVTLKEKGTETVVQDEATRNGGTLDIDLLQVALTGSVDSEAEGFNIENNKTKWVKIGDAYYYGSYVTGLEDILTSAQVSVYLDDEAGNEWQGLTATFTITVEAEQAEYVSSSTAAGAVADAAIDVATVADLFA